MNADYQELYRYLQRMEDEMRQLGWWSEQPPAAQAFESEAPFCHDSMTLEQWLQWVFIPKMRALIDAKKSLPEKCAIAPIGELTWQQESGELVSPLLEVMRDVDALLSR